MGARARVLASAFYGNYHGHTPSDLTRVVDDLRGENRPLRWLAGDSSLDNKYWLRGSVPAVNGMEAVLDPAVSVPDVAHCVNAECAARGMPHAAVNAAVEESTLGART